MTANPVGSAWGWIRHADGGDGGGGQMGRLAYPQAERLLAQPGGGSNASIIELQNLNAMSGGNKIEHRSQGRMNPHGPVGCESEIDHQGRLAAEIGRREFS